MTKQVDRYTDKKITTKLDRWPDIQRDRQTEDQTYSQAYKQPDRQTDDQKFYSSAVTMFQESIGPRSRTVSWHAPQTETPTSGRWRMPSGSRLSSSYASTEPPRVSSGHLWRTSSLLEAEPNSSRCVTSRKRTTGETQIDTFLFYLHTIAALLYYHIKAHIITSYPLKYVYNYIWNILEMSSVFLALEDSVLKLQL